jgi:hypothetical protein
VTQDEGPRKETSLEALSKLKPAFKADGKVTPGNASPMNDGGAAVVISSRAYAEKNGHKPMARIVGYAQAAVEPKYLFAAPAYAIPKLLKRIGWTLSDVDLIELNEAFAAQVLADGYALADDGWDWDKVNVNGGAIALGHPLGASGARVLTTLLYALKDRGMKRGIASLCLGGGEAVAIGANQPCSAVPPAGRASERAISSDARCASAPCSDTSSTPRSDPSRRLRSRSTVSATFARETANRPNLSARASRSTTAASSSTQKTNGNTRGKEIQRDPPSRIAPSASAPAAPASARAPTDTTSFDRSRDLSRSTSCRTVIDPACC